MTQFLNIFGFLAVILRALTLSCQSLVAGGIVFALVCLSNAAPDSFVACRKLIRWSALALALAQIAFVTGDAIILRATAPLPFGVLFSASFFLAGVASALAGLFCFFFVDRLRPGNWSMLIPATILLAASVMTSHAAARIDSRPQALILTALHQAATMAWIGGLPFLLIALGSSSGTQQAERIGNRFSRLAQGSVGFLLLSGVGLSLLYVASVPGLYGTSYGIMVLGKIFLFLVIAGLGALNLFLVRALNREPVKLLARLRRLSEAEVGIGFTVILAAASLTSQPPAADLMNGRVTVPEIVARFTPQTPRFESPRIDQLSPPTVPSEDPTQLTSFVPGVVLHPQQAGDIAWSEYNHNWSGMVVLAIGLLAVASRVFGLRWARHWPLAFIGLSLFLFFRADVEVWPLGPRGFWSSMADPEILQHRIFALLIVAFAIFEWGIQVNRIHSKAAALVFPGVCAIGGALLLTHSHALGNVKEQYLAELSHLPIAIFAVLAGWSRWLEQRLDGAWRKIPSTVWPVCFVMIGLMLLFYREA